MGPEVAIAQEAPFIREARKLGADDEKIAFLQNMHNAQGPLSDLQTRAKSRARTLIRGRGWPTERIEVFFPDQSGSELPSALGPTAVSVPRAYCQDLGESEVTRIILHEMVHARSMGLPTRSLPNGWQEDIGLYQLGEGLVEVIAEEIMPLPSRHVLLRQTREAAATLCQMAKLDVDALERLAVEEAILVIAGNLDWDLQQVSAWIKEKTGLPR